MTKHNSPVSDSQALSRRLALYTTIYPGVEKYLSAWYDSVLQQTDCEFDIWIGVDKLDVSSIIASIGDKPPATWVIAAGGDSPATVRQKAIERMVNEYPAVVFADSDDLLEPTRVEAARNNLSKSDVTACAMRLIDEKGDELGITASMPAGVEINDLLPKNNMFGLSNTAYRSAILSRCLPVPAESVIVDWFLATRAWALGACFSFDFTCRMKYRQYSSNIARVLPPFTPQQVLSAAEMVLNHYALVREYIPELKNSCRAGLEQAGDRARKFYKAITGSPELLNSYVNALNRLTLNHIWWEIVAHPQLEHIWRT